MGALVFVPETPLPNKMPAYQVIDGQQRLTTISLLLCALRNVAKEAGLDKLSGEITDTYLVHPYNKGRESFRVYPRQRDRDSYTSLIEGHQPTDADLPGSAVVYFMERIRTLPDPETEETLRELFHLLRARLDFVHITLQNENPYQIFKSLNSMGVALSEADLIRNFVFMRVDGAAQDDFDDHSWKPLEKHFETPTGAFDGKSLSAFFHDYLSRDGKYVKQDAVFETFEHEYGKPSLDIHALTSDLNANAVRYEFITGTVAHPEASVQASLVQLRELEATVTYPLVLRLITMYDTGVMTTHELSEAIRLLSGFIFRRIVCNESSRAYNRWFVSACAEVQNAPLDDLRAFLQNKGFPSDAKFEQQFTEFNLYASRYCKAVLARLERSFSHREPADLGGAQIEHVMPQKLTTDWENELGADYERVRETWLHTVGNLTLTAYNQELGNKSFAQKCDGFAGFSGYKNSNVVMTRDIGTKAQWTESEIRARAENLAKRAVTLWQGA